MSRIGKKVITLPKGVSVTIHDQALEVKGPKGNLKTPIPAGISFKLEGDQLQAERTSDDLAPLHGLARALANNAIVGVTEDGKAGVVVGVTSDLTARFSAVDLVRVASAALGGKGGGGRPDMAQAGGPDGAKAGAALSAIEKAIGG